MYIASATLNGKSYTKSYISYDDIMQGGEFHLYLQKKPASFIK
ncbi:glycoside hydrolase domain-containing protein [Danxiaibacter flavus]